jgi:hypothetical protein
MPNDVKTAPPVKRQGFLARLLGGLRQRVRKLFGKKSDGPNIYPFF